MQTPKEIPEFCLVRNPKELDLEQLSRLLESAGMRSRDRKRMSRAIDGSTEVIAVFLVSGGLIGFGRLISDGSYYGTIWDVAVDPDYQKSGIGTAVVTALLNTSRRLGLYMVGLFTALHNEQFYKNLGFIILDDIHPMKLQLNLSEQQTDDKYEK